MKTENEVKMFEGVFKGGQLRQLQDLRERQVAIRAIWRKQQKNIAKIDCCSGFILSDQLILTSAHNVYLDELQSFASEIQITFLDKEGKQNSTKKHKSSIYISLRPNENMVCDLVKSSSRKTYRYDMALIHVNNLILKSPCLKSLVGFKISQSVCSEAFVSGFPDFSVATSQKLEKSLEREPEFSPALRDDRGKLSKIRGNFIFYSSVETVTGQSGGPIMTIIRGKLFIIGMHSEYSTVTKTGKGLYFTSSIWQTLQGWAGKLYRTITTNSYLNQSSIEDQEDQPQKQVIKECQTEEEVSHDSSNCQVRVQILVDRSLRNFVQRITRIQEQLQTLKSNVEFYAKETQINHGKSLKISQIEQKINFDDIMSTLEQNISALQTQCKVYRSSAPYKDDTVSNPPQQNYEKENDEETRERYEIEEQKYFKMLQDDFFIGESDEEDKQLQCQQKQFEDLK